MVQPLEVPQVQQVLQQVQVHQNLSRYLQVLVPLYHHPLHRLYRLLNLHRKALHSPQVLVSRLVKALLHLPPNLNHKVQVLLLVPQVLQVKALLAHHQLRKVNRHPPQRRNLPVYLHLVLYLPLPLLVLVFRHLNP